MKFAIKGTKKDTDEKVVKFHLEIDGSGNLDLMVDNLYIITIWAATGTMSKYPGIESTGLTLNKSGQIKTDKE